MRPALKSMLILLLLPVLVLCQSSPARGAQADVFAAAMDNAVPELLKAYDVPGVSIAYIEGGVVAWAKGYGLADKGRGVPMTPDHILAHGSDGKVITTWAVLRLVDEGKVNLDAPAQDYLKSWQFPASVDGSRITVRMLLNHTSGLGPRGYVTRDPRFPQVDIVASLDGRNYGSGPVYQVAKPGTAYNYSGAGFAVAQLLVEDVTGEPFETYTERSIFGPLGMTTAAWHWTPALIADAATPYGTRGEALPFYDLSEAGAGSEMMTAADFARFVAAAVPGPSGEPAGRGVLKAETVAMAMTEQSLGNGSTGLGYGIGHLQNGEKYLMHLGGDPGWRAVFALQPDDRDGFVAVANSERGDKLMVELMDVWSRACHGSPLPLASGWNRSFVDPYGPMRSILTILAVALGAAALSVAIAVVRQFVKGQRSRLWRSHSVAKPAAIVVGLATWVTFFHTHIPIPWPASWAYVHWTWEIGLVTAALSVWALIGIAASIYPKRRLSYRPASRPEVRDV